MTPDRFFALMVLLDSREPVAGHDLASALGVSPRTINRDLNWLRDAGFPVTTQHGRGGGVALLPGGGVDLSRLTPEERDHLSLVGLDDEQRQDLGAAQDGRRALAKVRTYRSRPDDALLPLNEVVHVDSRPWRQQQPTGPSPAELAGAVRRRRQLRITYTDARGTGSRASVVDPYGLLAKAGIWYLVADCSAVPRLYRLERITSWSERDRRRCTRAGQTLATVVAELTERWEQEHEIDVSATVEAAQIERAQRIFGRQLRRDPRADTDAGPGVSIRFRHLEDVRALLPFGAAVTVHHPAHVRDRLRGLALELAEHHASTP